MYKRQPNNDPTTVSEISAEPIVPIDIPPPPGGDAPLRQAAPPVASSASSVLPEPVSERGTKRQDAENPAVDRMSQLRSERGPLQSEPVSPVTPSGLPTVRTGIETNRRARSRTPPPPRESSFFGFTDFPGEPSDHVHQSWYTDSAEHDYSGTSIGLEFDVWLDEIQNEESIQHVVRDMCFNAAAVRKRNTEVNERYLTPDEKEMFRAAKGAEWSQWLNNDVVELISRSGIDPRRVISSRWVLTWKPVDEAKDPDTKKAKARLVIRGFKDPDLGQFTTASPTLSRQGRHAVLTTAAHEQWRVFTLDAKTAFLAGDSSSRVKPIYAELPKDLIRDQGYDADTIARPVRIV